MTPKSIKRLAILVVFVAVVVGVSFWARLRRVETMARVVDSRAETAAKEGDYARAETLLREHLEIRPDDVDAQLRYAEVILKGSPTAQRQIQVMGIYNDVLTRHPSRDDARRALVDVEFGLSRYAETLNDVLILLKSMPTDGHLYYLSARCREQLNDEARALDDYQATIEHGAEERFEAYQREALLLRDRLGRPRDADSLIELMVKSDPGNYRVYLERGRYLKGKNDLTGARGDLEKAISIAPDQPASWLELADVVERVSGRADARVVLEKGVEAASGSVMLQEALASLEIRDGKYEVAIERLETALKRIPDLGRLRLLLASILAQSGDSGRLLLQIQELKKIGLSPSVLQYLMAYYYVNLREYTKAREALVPLQVQLVGNSTLKAQVNVLLARCYSQLGEPGMQEDAYLRAISANPQDLSARLGYIANLVAQGDIAGAIQGYEGVLERAPKARLPLARLLISRNLQLPEAQRDWGRINQLVKESLKDAPGAVDPIIVQAESLLAQDRFSDAKTLLDAASDKNPRSAELRVAIANLVARQGRYDDALAYLDVATKDLGDRVDLRLQRARIVALRKGAGVSAALEAIAQGIDAFSKDDRKTLLNGLALEFIRLQEYQSAGRLWIRLAEDDPNNMDLRLTLLDGAFQTGDRDQIESNIKRIQSIEGDEGLLGRYCQVRYLIWKAQRETDLGRRESLRISARDLLGELQTRRQDWSVLPLALAELAEQELAQGKLTDDEKRTLQETIVSHYLRAIDLGQHRSALVRRAVELLFALGRGNDALLLFNRIPVESQLAGDLGRAATRIALENRDFQRAEEIARRSVAANPANFQERIWLVQVLLASGRQAEGEVELRAAVDLAKTDPDRWLTLVQYLISTKQSDKAEKAAREAQASLDGPRAPLALAQCAELMGKGYEGTNDDKVKAWYGEARGWYEKARSAAPDDYTIVRRMTDFLIRTRQNDLAETQLAEVLKSSNSPDMVGWARRTLALMFASSGDPKKVIQALESMNSVASASPDDRSKPVDYEDLRVLARVLDAQKTPEHRKQAIKVLTTLINKNQSVPEDRYLLARIQDVDGDWPSAKEQYRELVLRTENPRDMETLTRRPLYIAQFANGLIRHRVAGDTADLAEASDLIDKLRRIQPDSFGLLLLEVDLHRARNQTDQAVKLIEDFAARGNSSFPIRATLAELAERFGRLELAERIFRELGGSPAPRGKLMLASFLGRHGRAKESLDICEPLWESSTELDLVAATCIEALLPAGGSPDPELMAKVASWFDKALAKSADSTTLLVGLGNLRERQGRYQDAQDLYSRAIKLGDKAGISLNNLAWLVSLKDGKGKEALDLIDQAIALKGPLPDFLDTRGVIYLRSGDNQRAITDLENAVAADPAPTKFFHLAQAYLEINNKEKAKQSLENARGKGLVLDGLHPLEQPNLRKLMNELGTP